jgi:hypothetical protein
VNETYVWVGSKAASNVKLNDIITLNFTYYSYEGREPQEKTLIVLSLKVVGFVELDEKAYSIATGGWGAPIMILQGWETAPITSYGDLLLIVSWEKTFTKLLDNIPDDVPYYNIPFQTQILVYTDRGRLINPWDIPSSMDALEKIRIQVNERVAKYGSMYVYDNLRMTLMTYYATSIAMRFIFIIVALPVFFVAWYVGTTVSDVSYNLAETRNRLTFNKGVLKLAIV